MEVKRTHILSLAIDNESDVGVCRRKAVALANTMGFKDVKNGEVAILVTELVTNVIKHGGGKGKIIICQIETEDHMKALEVWCCDAGEGIANFQEALKDGYSAAESLGVGLGSIRRFSDELEINPTADSYFRQLYFTELPSFNNCIRSRKWLPSKQWLGKHRELIVGAASRSKPGESLNGDAFVVTHINSHISIAAVIDGLGHGKEAHLASQLAREQIIQKSDLPLPALMNHIHQSIKGTRGAVIGLMSINTKSHKIIFTGIGNIESFLIHEDTKKTMLSFGGIMGHNMRTPRTFEFDFHAGDSICMYSDGITSRWKSEDLNWEQSPQQNAELIINKYSRSNDDATVLIIRHTL